MIEPEPSESRETPQVLPTATALSAEQSAPDSPLVPRLLIIAGLVVALVCVLRFVPLPFYAQLAAGNVVGLASILLVSPAYVRAFLRHEWLRLIGFLVLIGGVVGALWVATHPGELWFRLTGAVAAIGIAAGVLRDATYKHWIQFLTIEQWRAIDRETERAPGEAGATSMRVLIVLVMVAVSLTLQEYIGDRGYFERVFPARGRPDAYWELKGFAWWASWRVFGYVVLPLVTIAAMRDRVRDYHLAPQGFTKHLWIYVLLFLLISPAVIAASTTDAFRHTYPFYRLANRSQFDLWSWEGMYAVQFLSLEIFFRGFILHGLRRALGANAIFVMIVPYCMIHYGKPMPETFGAIGAGLILGTLAMRTRSIWGGVLIHIGVAISMDVLALRGCPPIGSNRWCGE